MATEKNTLKNWFKTGLKPTQSHFWAWLDSFWHKDEKIPLSNIDGMDKALENKAETSALDTKADKDELENYYADLTDKIDELRGIIPDKEECLDTLQSVIERGDTYSFENIDKRTEITFNEDETHFLYKLKEISGDDEAEVINDFNHNVEGTQFQITEKLGKTRNTSLLSLMVNRLSFSINNSTPFYVSGEGVKISPKTTKDKSEFTKQVLATKNGLLGVFDKDNTLSQEILVDAQFMRMPGFMENSGVPTAGEMAVTVLDTKIIPAGTIIEAKIIVPNYDGYITAMRVTKSSFSIRISEKFESLFGTSTPTAGKLYLRYIT